MQRQVILEDIDDELESFRNTEADDRHPAERDWQEQDYYNQLQGISLGPNSPDDLEVQTTLNFNLDEDPKHISHSLLAVLEDRSLLDQESSINIRKAK